MSSIANLTKSASIIFSMALSSSANCEPKCLGGRGGIGEQGNHHLWGITKVGCRQLLRLSVQTGGNKPPSPSFPLPPLPPLPTLLFLPSCLFPVTSYGCPEALTEIPVAMRSITSSPPSTSLLPTPYSSLFPTSDCARPEAPTEAPPGW